MAIASMTTAPRSAKKWPRMLLALGVVCIVSVLSSLGGIYMGGVTGGLSGGELLGVRLGRPRAACALMPVGKTDDK